MTKTIKLFLPNEFYEEMLYQYEDKDADLRKLIFGILKPLGKDGKLSFLHKMIKCKILKEGNPILIDKELKDLDLKKLVPVHDEKWIPEKVTMEEIKIYKLTISDILFKDLVSFATIFCAKLQIWNESLPAENTAQIAKIPSCFEEIIQNNAVTALSQSIAQNIDKGYDEEFDELEKKITDKSPPKRG